MIKQLVVVLVLIALSNAVEDETTSSYQFVALEKIYCETVESTASNEEEVFNYDCSHKDLTRVLLDASKSLQRSPRITFRAQL